MTKSERTKQTIIESSMKLFIEKGYDNTSVEDIVILSGIGKGTYYYHFKQKKDVLMYMIRDDFEQYFALSEKVAYDTNMNAGEKLEKIMTSLFLQQESRYEIDSYFDNGIPSNFRASIDCIRFSKLVPIIQRVLEQGNNEELFHVEHIEVVTSIVVRGIVAHIDAATITFTSNDEFFEMVKGIETLLEKILGYKIKI